MLTRNAWLYRSLILPVLLLTSCGGTIQSGGFKVDQSFTEETFEKVTNRAAFDFSCPKEKIEVIVISAGGLAWSGGKVPDQVGASGCNHKGVYVRTPSGWVLNSGSGKEK